MRTTNSHPLAGRRHNNRGRVASARDYDAARAVLALTALWRDLATTRHTMHVEGEDTIALGFAAAMTYIERVIRTERSAANGTQVGFGLVGWADTLEIIQPHLDVLGLIVISDPESVSLGWPPALFDFADTARCAYATFDDAA